MSRAVKVAANAVIGGTAEELGGGKFANGAITGVFSMLFNDLMHQEPPESMLKKMGVDGISGAAIKNPTEGMDWIEGMSTVHFTGESYIVVSKKTGKYINIMDEQLYKEFDKVYYESLNSNAQKYYNNPVYDQTPVIALISTLTVFACNPISGTTVKDAPWISLLRPDRSVKDINTAVRNYSINLQSRRIKWYSKFGIINK